MELFVFPEQRPAGRGTGHGRLFGLAGQRPERAADEARPHGEHRRRVRRLSGADAHAGLAVRAHYRAVFQGL